MIALAMAAERASQPVPVVRFHEFICRGLGSVERFVSGRAVLLDARQLASRTSGTA